MRFSIKPALSLALASATLALGLVACGGDSGFEVNTTLGAVSGTETASSYAYRGIPYAAPPVGPLRWRAPAAATPWSGTRSGANFAPHCAQPASPFGTASTSEDCLYLNVYTPKVNGIYPVLVWIHGGAFYLGLSNAFDPSALVAKGVVVVTINYRLGALGFMSHSALTAEPEQSGSSGNYGLMDQQAALRWVRSNIANFGGNASNITIMGESAGGFSVHSHVASAGSAGLFHKAIAMSGAYPFGAPQDSLAVAQLKGAGVATAVAAATSTTACTTVECLRALPVSELLTAQASVYPSGPVPSVDGRMLTANVRTTIAAGTHNRVPMIEGTTRDEWRLFVALDEFAAAPLADNAAHIAKVTALLGGALNPAAGPTATNLVTNLYPTPPYPDASVAYGALGTDMIFSCNGRIAALELQQHAAVYAYEFRDRTAPTTIPHRSTFSLGAYHGSELQYIFPSSLPLTAEQQALGATMTTYWTNFMKTGNPNGTGVPTWAAFTAAADGYQGLDIASGGGVAALGTNFATSHNCTALNGGVFTPTP